MFGFNQNFLLLIKSSIENYFFSIIINGSNHGYFNSTHGLRQGDPLSPSLFIIVKLLTQFLYGFQNISGLYINRDKSNFITSKSVNNSRHDRIKRVCGFSSSSLPIKYLGTPLFKGRKRTSLFENIFSIFQRKFLT
ncbi:putative mitochondrial protein [Dendrobium catenatum]|uniref:Putative mitochondrial protein n=1 Tax=Dendrobium catenatum TaxID=906689 RepID=A0A2I0X028_9ASPA|nr:putative mitochondrial protein [Dendrobium catenatum]